MKILITGGAGFIGSNVADYYLLKGDKVTIFDNFSREGSKENLKWLTGRDNKPKVIEGDVRQIGSSFQKELASGYDVVFHFAAQVAVTTSVTNPKEDFKVNALGTVNLLESIRLSKTDPIFVYSSTNKVYGNMENLETKELPTRYDYVDKPTGVSESQPLDFHSPYGCSKGCADQYVHDYSRIYGLRSIVFRQSCIYGIRQFGIEDQGWIAWFIIALSQGKKLTIYGDGKQVRDLLYISDLVQAYDLAIKNIKNTSGQIYNMGGGGPNSVSVWAELKPILEKLFNRKISVDFQDWRPGDQKVCILDTNKAKSDFEWTPKVNVEEGVKFLYNWIQDNIDIIPNK